MALCHDSARSPQASQGTCARESLPRQPMRQRQGQRWPRSMVLEEQHSCGMHEVGRQENCCATCGLRLCFAPTPTRLWQSRTVCHRQRKPSNTCVGRGGVLQCSPPVAKEVSPVRRRKHTAQRERSHHPAPRVLNEGTASKPQRGATQLSAEQLDGVWQRMPVALYQIRLSECGAVRGACQCRRPTNVSCVHVQAQVSSQ